MKEMLRKYHILVAPLDWGLGHATRCIPVVKELLANDCDVSLAGEGIQEALLRTEFPDLPFLSLDGYRIRYSRRSWGFLLNMALQIPKILFAIRKEHRWLKKMVRSHKIDAVISDNRFGLYHSKIPSIFITHQLSIKSPLGNWNEKILQRWNYKYINRFRECWIPDLFGENNLAGELSHPHIKPVTPVKYIGPISRFDYYTPLGDESNDHLLFILSGPEPQRTGLENKIINEISHYEGTATIVRGLPTTLSIIPSSNMIKFYNHLPAKELSNEIQKADFVISRCGYSTVMDLVKLQKKMIMIPTPGQTEQEYLAKHLQQKQIAFTIRQKEFSLNMVLREAKKFKYRLFSGESKNLQIVIGDFIKRMEK
jgi:uncharacterized protein (TIGR00661 family)